MSLLPPVIHVPADPVGARDVAAIVELLAQESALRRPGSRAAAARLLDMLLIAAVRHWVDTHDDADASWLRALRDPTSPRHCAPARPTPARRGRSNCSPAKPHLSRSALARRLHEFVGAPQLATSHAGACTSPPTAWYSTDTVETIARDVGYTSEYAFNRAFSRHRGQPPGRYRRLARAT